jgi:hypothetical protein
MHPREQLLEVGTHGSVSTRFVMKAVTKTFAMRGRPQASSVARRNPIPLRNVLSHKAFD